MRQMTDIVDDMRKLEAYAARKESPLKTGDLTRLTLAFAMHRVANELGSIRQVLQEKQDDKNKC